ncbi:MAG: BT_3928 family protein [Cyclobacteriaceae bacterium]
MNKLLYVIRIIIGGLFIFSGLIKVNDPVGTSIKLEEYFDVFATDIAPFFEAFKAISLPIAVILVVLEVTLGVMVIVGWRIKWGIYLLLPMILFFTFLTFYSAYFDKVTDCGCFGDAIKLTPWGSFYKDIFLLVLILLLFFFRGKIKENTSSMALFLSMGSLVMSLTLAIMAIRNLPFVDFRSYKEGVNITAALQPSAPLSYNYRMKKGEEFFVFDQYPSDESYEFVEMTLNNPEALPKISDFAIWNESGDYTEQVLEGKKLLILTSNISKMEVSIDYMDAISSLINEFQGTDVEVIMVGASTEEELQKFLKSHNWSIPNYLADATVVKTIIRSNPGLVFLEDGTILKKYHYRNAPDPQVAKSVFYP